MGMEHGEKVRKARKARRGLEVRGQRTDDRGQLRNDAGTR
jgi:ribosomal protein S13